MLAGGVTALPALAVGPWMLIGLMAGFSGTDLGTGEPGPTDWGAVVICSVGLVLCVAVPLLVGWGTCRLLDRLVVGRHRGAADHPDRVGR
ncbi:hypothetical protein SAMN03159343_3593 [Klenkia marina]|uniref:Uncharacterized protein n=1 Tax=Klenkia marina TaxID=1960309 RepID=A0A1G4YUL4_9ACTN|nr:hypothetical protein SAMN03159343_3593 [Klenkia marina]